MDKKINSLPLSYGLSLSDMYKNDRIVYIKKRIRSLKKKIVHGNHKKKAGNEILPDVDTNNFDFIKPNVPIDFKTGRELSIFNSVYSIMEKLKEE
jgi:hypothetical protein